MEKRTWDSNKADLKQQILLHVPDLLGQRGLISDGEKIHMKRIIEQEKMRGP